MPVARQFQRILGVSSIVVFASCDAFLPPHRERAIPAERHPIVVEQPRTAGKKPRPRAAPEPTPAQASAAFAQISGTLRRLVGAEQGFFAETGAYTDDLGKLAFRRVGQSEIAFLWVGADGWAARGTHPELPGRDCVIFVGVSKSMPVSQRYGRSGRPGVPACDEPAPPSVAARASDTTTPPPPADTTSALDAVSPAVQMKVDLRKMIQAQEAYHGTMGTYTRNIETLPLQFAWQDQVEVTVVNADARSWSARATHTRHPGKSCVIWVGPVQQRPATERQRRSPQRSGTPACDN